MSVPRILVQRQHPQNRAGINLEVDVVGHVQRPAQINSRSGISTVPPDSPFVGHPWPPIDGALDGNGVGENAVADWHCSW